MDTSAVAFDVNIAHSVDEIGQAAWDALSAGRPFSSYGWYKFGETVMAGCLPVYITLQLDSQPIARATCFLVAEEPLPIESPALRGMAQSVLRRWPLLICRAPLANMSGLALPDAPMRDAALKALMRAAEEQARELSASFLVFDNLTGEMTGWQGWGADVARSTVSGVGTQMAIQWSSYDNYIAQLSKNNRKHHRRVWQACEAMELRITRHREVTDADTALALIRTMERRYKSPPNPWMVGMMRHLPMVDGCWLAARLDGRLVGCELAFIDNGAQVVTALGLAENTPYAYFALGYEDIRFAIESGVRALHWGSGAYDFKQALGFELEDNNYVIFSSGRPWLQKLGQWIGG